MYTGEAEKIVICLDDVEDMIRLREIHCIKKQNIILENFSNRL